jgi:hypothetical protein
MALTGRREGAEALRERIGPDARYSTFMPPGVRGATIQPKRQRSWAVRVLWCASLISLAVVLVLTALVALGF